MLRVSIVQQSAWDLPVDSMPLAAGYLKAFLEADREIGSDVDVTICNFRGGMTLPNMARQLFTAGAPDILAFSVLGWNYRNFSCLAEMYKQLKPDGLVVFGGNHVAKQAERVFRQVPDVDVLVNGEGEISFRDLIAELMKGDGVAGLGSVPGISYRDPEGKLCHTPDAPRIEHLDSIPSPFLSGAIPMVTPDGHFGYEFALMETNRGCPYKCAFCYWGGAVGQRVRSFSRERLAAELDVFGFYQVPTVFLCDANFGMLEADEEFVEDLIRTRERYGGYPRAIEANWAKNKSDRFHQIVKVLKDKGMTSSFTLALQTLTDEALTDMRRRNMRVNQWEDLVDWLNDEGLSCYAELIWGAPGDTPSTFLDGYDRLAVRVPRIAVYPMLLLPNTAYTEQREQHKFVTIRGQFDDFEYVLGNRSSTLAENLAMQRFMYLARLLGENQYFKRLWALGRQLAGMRQSEMIMSLLAWIDGSRHPAVLAFRDTFPVVAESPAVARGHRMLYAHPDLDQQVEAWWVQEVVPAFPAPLRDFGAQWYAFERLCRPVYQPPGAPVPPGWRVEGDGYVSDPASFGYRMEETFDAVMEQSTGVPREEIAVYEFRAPRGFYEHLDNHETGAHYFGSPLLQDSAAVKQVEIAPQLNAGALPACLQR
jgi:radical SAM C-methyltransferase